MPAWELDFPPFANKQTVGSLTAKWLNDEGVVIHTYFGSANLDIKSTVDDFMRDAEASRDAALAADTGYEEILAKRQKEVN